MTAFELGALHGVPASSRPDLLAAAAAGALTALPFADEVGVVEIDAELSDTAATELAYGLTADRLVNCVVVAGRREGEERVAACCVRSDTRADVNGTVKRTLDVRKASFLPRDDAVVRTAMEFGGITPLGLPHDWPVLVDAAVLDAPLVVIGSGIRRSKLLLPGRRLAELPGAVVLEGLGRPIVPRD